MLHPSSRAAPRGAGRTVGLGRALLGGGLLGCRLLLVLGLGLARGLLVLLGLVLHGDTREDQQQLSKVAERLQGTGLEKLKARAVLQVAFLVSAFHPEAVLSASVTH